MLTINFNDVQTSVISDLHSAIANDKTGEMAKTFFNILNSTYESKPMPYQREEVLDVLENMILQKIGNERSITEDRKNMRIRKGDVRR